MRLQRHDWVECPTCGTRLWYGLKAETTGWTVYYECGDCCFETRAGRVAMDEVKSRDEAAKRARTMAERI